MGGQLSSIVFQPPEVTYTHARRPLVWLRTKSKTQIPAFYLDNQSKITILFSHGNAEDLGMIYDWLVNLGSNLSVNVLAYDYEGYGKTTGFPSERACYENIEAAYSYLVDRERVPPETIVLYGRSIGSGPSLYLAEKLAKDGVRLGALILQSPLMSIFRVAFPFRFTFPCDMFPNIDRIGNITCPVFIVHGTKDEVVPFWNGEQLFLAAPVHLRARPFWIDGGGHNNLEIFFKDQSIFLEQFREFFTEWMPMYVFKGPTLPEVSESSKSSKSRSRSLKF